MSLFLAVVNNDKMTGNQQSSDYVTDCLGRSHDQVTQGSESPLGAWLTPEVSADIMCVYILCIYILEFDLSLYRDRV